MATRPNARYRSSVKRLCLGASLALLTAVGCGQRPAVQSPPPVAPVTKSTPPPAATTPAVTTPPVAKPPLQPKRAKPTFRADPAWTRVTSALRARMFSVRRSYCPGEPVDLVMLIHNTSPKRAKLRYVRAASEVGPKWRPNKSYPLAIRWQRKGLMNAMQLPIREHAKRLERLPLKLNPGEMFAVTIRLSPRTVPRRKLQLRRLGEPRRMELEFLGRPRGYVILEASWAPLVGDTRVKLQPVHVRVFSAHTLTKRASNCRAYPRTP